MQVNDNKIQSKKTVITSLIWKLLERFGTQGIQFIVTIIIARLLMPEDYGIIALITVFIVLANVFIKSGIGSALIQKKDADEVDFSSIFYLSLAIAVFLYIVLFFCAPLISDFYQLPLLVPVLRILALTLIFGALNSIQNAYVSKNMLFKKLFFSSTGAIIVSGTLGILAAYKGLGVWALVAQQLSSQITITVILWFTVKWRPKLIFSFSRVKKLYSYGWKLLVSALIDRIYNEIRTLIIGKKYSSDMLGFYNKGNQIPNLIVDNINGSIQAVIFPALSAHQDNISAVKDMVRRAIKSSLFLIFPMMIGLAVVAEPLVKILLTDKWLPAVPFIRTFCLSYSLWPIHTANLQAINALGRSDIYLYLELIKKTIGIVIIIITVLMGNIMAIAWGVLINGTISSFINAFPNKKLLKYSYIEQIKDILPFILLSLFMGISVYCLTFLLTDVWLLLTAQILGGVIIYFAAAKLLRFESLKYITDIVKEMFNKKGK